MTGEIESVPTSVPISGGRDVTVSPGQPWPSTYRGSRYSIVESRRRNRDHIVRWSYRDLQADCHPPDGLREAFERVGKSAATGKGSFRVTADGEVLTKVHADEYPHTEQAPHANGWIPVYVGSLAGKVGFTKINNDPSSDDAVQIWDGFPFHHGECWTVSHDGRLIWRTEDYTFESAFEHSELIEVYNTFRKQAGRLYLNEYGHVWVNAPAAQVPDPKEGELLDLFDDWREEVKRAGNTAGERLVMRRLKQTSHSDDPKEGHLPLYIGHLSDFDDGLIPRPVVTDSAYFVACSRDESSDGGY